MPLTYDPRTGQYRGEDGRFVPRSAVLGEVQREVVRQEARMQAIARLLIEDKITIPEFQIRAGEALKASGLRMAALAAGGRESLTARHFGRLGAELRYQYDRLANLGMELEFGEVTAAQLLYRMRLFARASTKMFHQQEKITRENEGFNQARRELDPQASHCPSCPEYATDGWVAIAAIIPPGTDCECGNNCRCRVFYRRFADVVRDLVG